MTPDATVAFHLFWLIGLALIVAGLSYASWQADQKRVKLRTLLNAPSFQTLLSGGLLLVSLSLALLAGVWWERLIWVVFMGLFGWQLWDIRRETGAK